MTTDDVCTMLCVMVSIKIAHGEFKYCSTHGMFQMMVNMTYILCRNGIETSHAGSSRQLRWILQTN